LWAKDTIDERVLDLLNSKKALSDYVIDDDMSE
jgi:SNF2 family DNA or RNA helicase